MSKKVMVAMSGGVDSSVAAMLLTDEGYNVSGVTMCLGIAAEEDSARCCGAAAIDDAKRVCDRLKIPHYVFDYAVSLKIRSSLNLSANIKKEGHPIPASNVIAT
jgi:tRNA-specific 2-thiouridylase